LDFAATPFGRAVNDLGCRINDGLVVRSAASDPMKPVRGFR
jgi:hypothetical protein